MNEPLWIATKRTSVLLAVALAGALAVPGTAAKDKTPSDWLSLNATFDPATCTFTPTVAWAGFNGAKTLEVFVTEGYAGSKLVPTYVPVNNKTGIATVTLPPLAPSATLSNFYPWAQLLDSHGVAIPASLDFASVQPAYCTAP